MKRFLSVLMALVMTVSLLTTGVLAADSPETDSVAHVHVFDQKTLIASPTCKTEGIVLSYCTGEGDCELPGRMWSEPLSTVECVPMEQRFGIHEVSCTRDGYTGDVCCKWCMTVLEEGEVIPMTGHTPGDRVVDAWNSDETTTVIYRFCTVCKQIADKEEVPTDPEQLPEAPKAHTHVFGEAVIEVEPTCQTEGLSVSYCTAEGYCDLIGRAQSEVLPKAACVPADHRIGQADATCYTEGRTGDQICKWCMTVLEESEAIPMTAHTPAESRIGEIAATCITEGRTGALLCRDCLTVMEESEATPKADHTYSEWITDEWSSDDTVIVRRRFCTVCLQQTDYEEITLSQTENPFTDVEKDDYYYNSVLWAVENKVTAGTSATTFSPDKVCTRAEVVTMLWRAAGSPAPLSVNVPFTDVPADAYYRNAVLWAVEHGVTAGTTETTFSPDELCTRAQVMTMLWRAKESPLSERTQEAFLDVAKDDYFYLPVLWAVENDITGGTGFFLFSPDAPCSRAQIVTFLYKAEQ